MCIKSDALFLPCAIANVAANKTVDQKKRRPSPHLIAQIGEGRRYPIWSMLC